MNNKLRKQERVTYKLKKINQYNDNYELLYSETNKNLICFIMDNNRKPIWSVGTYSPSFKEIFNKNNVNVKNTHGVKVLANLVINYCIDNLPGKQFFLNRKERMYCGKLKVFCEMLREKGVKF